MALRGLPIAKQLSSALAQAENRLAEITVRLGSKRENDQSLLDDLVALLSLIHI